MENELKSLKAAMDATAFKDAAFDSTNKQAVREALNKKKRSFPLAPLVAVAALFLVVVIGMSTWLQNNQSAAPEPPPETHIFEGMLFQGQTNSGDSLQFIDGNLTIFTDPMMSAVRPWMDPDDPPAEQASETTYSNVTVVREDSLFSVYSDGNLVFTLIQTAPRMFEDASGNVYVTQQYIEEVEEAVEFAVYEGKPLHIGIIGEAPTIRENNIRFTNIDFEELKNSQYYDAIFITKSNLEEADKPEYASIYRNSPRPFLFIESTKSYIPFIDEDTSLDEFPDVNTGTYAYLFDGTSETYWGYGLYNDLVNENTIQDAYSRIFKTVEELSTSR